MELLCTMASMLLGTLCDSGAGDGWSTDTRIFQQAVLFCLQIHDQLLHYVLVDCFFLGCVCSGSLEAKAQSSDFRLSGSAMGLVTNSMTV